MSQELARGTAPREHQAISITSRAHTHIGETDPEMRVGAVPVGSKQASNSVALVVRSLFRYLCRFDYI